MLTKGEYTVGQLAEPNSAAGMAEAITALYGRDLDAARVVLEREEDLDRLQGLLTTDIPREMRAPGTGMHDALSLRDKWESLLLRTARWSPAPLELTTAEVA